MAAEFEPTKWTVEMKNECLPAPMVNAIMATCRSNAMKENWKGEDNGKCAGWAQAIIAANPLLFRRLDVQAAKNVFYVVFGKSFKTHSFNIFFKPLQRHWFLNPP